jgi:hypothetical protein
MSQAHNPSYWLEMLRWGGLQFQANPGKKFTGPHLKQWLSEVMCACHPSYIRKHKWRLMVQDGLGLSQK